MRSISGLVRYGVWTLALSAGLAGSLAAQAPPPAPWAEAFAGPPRALLAAAQALAPPPGDLSVDTLLVEASYRIEADGRATLRRRHVYRLLSADAVDEDEGIEQSWSPWHQERPRLRARVITADGGEHWLDEATIAEAGTAKEALIFDDDRVLSAPLPALAVGALVETETVVVETAPFFGRGTVRTEGIWAEHVRRFLVEVDAPERSPFRFVLRLLPTDAARETYKNGRRSWTYELHDWKPEYRFLDGRPPEEPAFPYVAFTTGSTWRAVAEAYSEIVDQVIASADVAAAVAAASKGAKSEHERIERLVRHVQSQVRYTGIEFGAAKIVPYSPAVVLERRYGDCKDKAALLVAMLREAGIPAYLALVQTNEFRETEVDLPGLGLFNHAIVHIPGSPGVWIDATVEQARAGQLPIGEQGRWALIASSTTSGLVRIPEDPAVTNRVRVERELHLAPLGKGRVVERASFEGWPELELRSWLATAKDSTRKSSLEAYTENGLLSKEIERFAFTPVDDFARPLERSLEVSEVGRIVTELEQALVAFRYDSLLGRVPGSWQQPAEKDEEPEPGEEPEAPRTVDFLFEEPHLLEVHSRILPPPGYRVRQLPEARTETLGTLKLETRYREEADGTVDVLWRFDSGQRRLSPAQLAETRQKLSTFLAEQEAVFVFFDQVAFAEVRRGDARQGILELRRQAEAAPKDGLARVRLAKALLDLGLVEPARDFAAEAVRLAPELAAAHEVAGLAWMHGLYGKLQGPGWNRDAAVAAYRQATRLEATNQTAWSNLGIALEHSPSGVRYGRGWDPEGVAEAFAKVLEEEPDSAARINRAVALGRLGRWQEAADLWPKGSQETAAKLYRALAAHASGGIDALARLVRRESSAESQGELISGAAGLFFLFRHYDEARAVLALPEAAKLTGSGARLLGQQRQVLAKLRRYESEPAPSGEPQAVLAAVARWIADGAPEAALPQLFSRHTSWQPLARKRDVAPSLDEALRRDFQGAGDILFPAETAADAWASLLELELEGDPSFGYRAKPRLGAGAPPAAAGLAAIEVSLVQEEGRWRWLDSAPPGWPVFGHLRELERQGRAAELASWLALLGKDVDEPGSYEDPWQLSPRAVLRARGADASPSEVELAWAAFSAPFYALLAAAKQLEPADRTSLERSLARLQEARLGAPEPRLSALEQVLSRTLETLGRKPEALALLEAAAERHPESKALRAEVFDLLSTVGPPARASAWLEARLAADPRAKELPRWRCEMQARQGLYTDAARCHEQLTEAREPVAADFNQAAWFYLVAGEETAKAIDLAHRGVELLKTPDYGILHTQAYAQALAHQLRDAAETFRKAQEAKRGDASDADALVLGQLAESCGLTEAARRWYQRAIQLGPEEPQPSSSSTLAKRSLERLEGPKGKKK